MPYRSVADLPDGVKVLPAGAQRLWMTAYNYADTHKDRFGTQAARAQYAWGAVKRVYKKDATGKWVKMSKDETDFIFEDPESVEEFARLFFQLSDETWEKLSAEERRAFIDQIPVKLEEPTNTDHEPADTDHESTDINYDVKSVTCAIPNIEWQKIGDVAKMRGTLIKEGTWTGLDGETIFYSSSIFPDAAPGILSAAIKRGHKADEDAVVGFVTASIAVADRIDIEGIIFDEETISDMALGKLTGISMEADVKTRWCDDRNVHIAQSMDLLKATLVEAPACDSCRVGAVQAVALKKSQKKEKRKMSEDIEYMLLYAKPTKTAFFEHIRGKLSEAEVEEDVVTKVMAILQTSIKVPYPSPAPVREAPPQEAPPVKVDTGEEDAEKKKMADEIDALKATITEKEDALTTKDTDLTQKDDAIKALEKTLEDIKKAEINALLEKIKGVDSAFNEEEILEGVEGLDARKKLLESYLVAIVKLSAKTKIQVDTPSNAEERVSKILKEIGISDLKTFLEKR